MDGYGLWNKRIKDRIREYKLADLYSLDLLQEYFQSLADRLEIDLLLTGRHGEKLICLGDYENFNADVVKQPGRKLRVMERTIGHLYTKDRINHINDANTSELTQLLLSQSVCILEKLLEQGYLLRETSQFMREQNYGLNRTAGLQEGKVDFLTGVLHRTYFENRMQVIERSEIVPVAIINANINDWKCVNDKYGEQESDRLIRLVAQILQEQAKPEYIIGRTDGDVFHILITIPDPGEAEAYCQKVKKRCAEIKDSHLLPSVAMGYVLKTNVEESMKNLMSDAEYEMFQDKLEMKQAVGYKSCL